MEGKRGRGRPRKFFPDQLLEKWEEYWEKCMKEEKFPTQEGFCIFLDINPDTFYNYLTQPDYSDVKKKIDAMLLDFTIQSSLTAKNPAFLIFYLKNKFGWTDKQEVSQDIRLETHFEQQLRELLD